MKELMISTFKDGVYGEEKDAFAAYGIKMGDGFIDTLMQPSPIKELITTDSRLENGVRVNISSAKVNKRSVTLSFVITNGNGKSMIENLRLFYSVLYNIRIRLRVPRIEEGTYYHLYYTGRSISYGSSIDKKISKLSVGFDEPNPTNRSK